MTTRQSVTDGTPPCPCGSTSPRPATNPTNDQLAAVCPDCGRTEPIEPGELAPVGAVIFWPGASDSPGHAVQAMCGHQVSDLDEQAHCRVCGSSWSIAPEL